MRAHKRAWKAEQRNRIPEQGERVKVVSGPHKGKFGTLVEISEDVATIADKQGKTISVYPEEVRAGK